MVLAKCLIAVCLFSVIGRLVESQVTPSSMQSYPGQVVFLGDFLIDYWYQNGYPTWVEFYEPLGINFGFSGDLTTKTLQRITDGLIDNVGARVAVLLIGTNDLASGGHDEQQTNSTIGLILDQIKRKMPDCKILLLGVLPRAEVEIHQKINNLNNMLAQQINKSDVFFLDMGEHFSTGLGQLIPELYVDGVHLTSEGYRVWANTMNSLLFELIDNGQIEPTTQSPNHGQVVFMGDSITDWWRYTGRPIWEKYYKPLGAVDTGFAGDTTADVIRRITNDGIIDDLNARMAVIKIGTNDLSKEVPNSKIVNNIGTILNLLRERNPGVNILLLGILPRKPREMHLKADEVNTEIAKYASASDDVWFLNMNDAFSYDWGMIYPELYWDDNLHLNLKGYEKWADIMNPLFFEIFNGTSTKPTEEPYPTTTVRDLLLIN